MTLIQAFILGLVQGLTEFLPVSSSAHLVFVQHLMGFRGPLLFFDVVVHVGTLTALFIYFASDLAHVIRDSIYGVFFLFQKKSLRQIAEVAPASYWGLGIIVASIPTGLMGILFKDQFESLFGSIKTVGFTLFGTTLLLWLTRHFQKGEKGIAKATLADFLMIGTFQGIAITPGISRSGSTISAALYKGIQREEAFRFSFLLAIPAILGAALLELKHGFSLPHDQWTPVLVGFVTAAISGYISLMFLAAIMKREKLHRFALYTFSFGCLVLLFAYHA